MKLLSTFLCFSFLSFVYGDDITELANSSFYQTGNVTFYSTDLNTSVTTFLLQQTPIEEWEDVPQGLRLAVMPDQTLLTSRDDNLLFIYTPDSCTYMPNEFHSTLEDTDEPILYFLAFATEISPDVYAYLKTDTNYTFGGTTYTGNITYTATIVNDTVINLDVVFQNDIILVRHQFNFTTFIFLTPDFSVYRLPPSCDDDADLCTRCYSAGAALLPTNLLILALLLLLFIQLYQ
ncbi:hypothetical protein LOD99_15769 [Oopsacas minuta]|uniref:Uncharacterized protein n=1 Tax=Oopsacas minuta TaxID=111878 RepID=A0AAV7K9L3_9METZ|nr:hypothetical protein LOD99_15769 [Oopsacas minuta]